MGKVTDAELRGDEGEVLQRRNEAIRRRTAAIQAHLEKAKPVAKAPVSGAALAADREKLKMLRGIAQKTAGKVATDEHSFDLFVAEQELSLMEGMYPSEDTMVEFASWLTRHRERVCLAQRPDSGPRLEGLVGWCVRRFGICSPSCLRIRGRAVLLRGVRCRSSRGWSTKTRCSSSLPGFISSGRWCRTMRTRRVAASSCGRRLAQ